MEVLEYVLSHTELFDEFELRYILYYIRCVPDELFLPDLIRELYDQFGIVSDRKNIYLGFIDLLKENFDIQNSNIIEVGGGIFPCLGKRISLLQDRGTITVYDPRLSFYEGEMEHLKLVGDFFTSSTDVHDTDLLIGFMPCKGAEALIESAVYNEIDFMLALCEGGPHGDYYDYFESDEEWIDSILYRAGRGIEDHHMGVLKTEFLKQYGDPYPIIYNKK